MIILPRPFGLRHAQIIGAERGRVARVARFDAVHRAQRHAGGVLLAQLLGQKLKRKAAAGKRFGGQLCAVADEPDGFFSPASSCASSEMASARSSVMRRRTPRSMAKTAL